LTRSDPRPSRYEGRAAIQWPAGWAGQAWPGGGTGWASSPGCARTQGRRFTRQPIYAAPRFALPHFLLPRFGCFPNQITQASPHLPLASAHPRFRRAVPCPPGRSKRSSAAKITCLLPCGLLFPLFFSSMSNPKDFWILLVFPSKEKQKKKNLGSRFIFFFTKQSAQCSNKRRSFLLLLATTCVL
jgi:hypothetical protein